MMTPEERNANVYDLPIEEMSLEYLEELTDEFTTVVLTTFFGEEQFHELNEQNMARFEAVRLCDRFIKMMLERAQRTTEHQTTVNYLNSLL